MRRQIKKYRIVKLKVASTFNYPDTKVNSPEDMYNVAKKVLYGGKVLELVTEKLFVIGLDSANQILGYMKVSEGGLYTTICDIRVVLKFLLDILAVKCILVHNHPAGSIIISNSDKEITKKLSNSLKVLDMEMLDHIILSGTREGGFTSFLKEDLSL